MRVIPDLTLVIGNIKISELTTKPGILQHSKVLAYFNHVSDCLINHQCEKQSADTILNRVSFQFLSIKVLSL